MEKRHLTKKEIVDLIVANAQPPYAPLTGDKRDGDTPRITIKNFNDEGARYAAKALRARLSRLSLAKLVKEGIAALEYVDARREQLQQYIDQADRNERDDIARALRQRQAELGRRHGLQPPILEAARHYRALDMEAKQAWNAIKQKPFATNDGKTVVIEAAAKQETMCVLSQQRKQTRSGIKFNYWQRRYWTAAKP
jgi:hypothetical protein